MAEGTVGKRITFRTTCGLTKQAEPDASGETFETVMDSITTGAKYSNG